VHSTISNAKNKLLDAQAYARTNTGFYEGTVARIFAKYQQLLNANNALDFDDLLLRTAQAMREHPPVLKELQERFKYILVDEYQDTNHAQYVIAHALALKHRNICVVGDPDQSIYAWRGADLNNILDFEKDYPDATVIRLEQNYRSTQTILAIAQKLISHNVRRKEKSLWTQNQPGEKARVLFCQDEHNEARAVSEELAQLRKTGIPWSKMAIFYRMNALSRVMEDALRRGQIPYQIARGVEFYNRKEIKDVLAYLRTIANPKDEVSLTRIINVPTRGIGDGSVKLMEAQAVATGTSLWETMRHAKQIAGLSTRAAGGVENFVRLIESLRAIAAAPPVRTIMEQVVQRSGMEAMLKKLDPTGENELANVEELISAAAEYDQENPEGSLDDYLSRVSLVSDADHLADSGGAVTLMTLHAAKGLEFPVVAIIGLEEGCLPHSRSRDSADELEEERRLCFVGITRAQERIILSKAAYRTIRGLRERTATSQFLMQMPQENLEILDQTDHAAGLEDEAHGISMDFQVGQAVAHAAFGVGRIVEMSNAGINTRAIIEFPRSGRKTLILEYANLKPVQRNGRG
jgi:DNA helicase-2/ATP-dependent DNA helicase PcrA